VFIGSERLDVDMNISQWKNRVAGRKSGTAKVWILMPEEG
jgi:hypothetical protein